MSHNVALSSIIGMGVGVISISISVYLQLLAKKHCKPKYVLGYLIVGLLMMTVNITAVSHTALVIETITVITYLVILLIELYYAYILRSSTGDEVIEDIDVEKPFKF